MKGMFIIWGIVLSAIGVSMGLGSSNPTLRAFFSKDPILVLGRKSILNYEEKKILADAIFAALHSPQSENSQISVRQRLMEANEALDHLYHQAASAEKITYLEPLMQYYATLSAEQAWMQKMMVIELLQKRYDPLVVDSLVGQVLGEENPNLFLGSKGAQREILLELAQKDSRVLEQMLLAISNEFKAATRELANLEMQGSPCPVSLSGALLIEVLGVAGAQVPVEQKKAMVTQLLFLAPDQTFASEDVGNENFKPIARTTRLDVMSAMARFGFDRLDELDLLAWVLMDETAEIQSKSVAARLILALLNNPGGDAELLSKRLAQDHHRCSLQPNFSYLEMLAQPADASSRALGSLLSTTPSEVQEKQNDAIAVRKVFEDSHKFACVDDE